MTNNNLPWYRYLIELSHYKPMINKKFDDICLPENLIEIIKKQSEPIECKSRRCIHSIKNITYNGKYFEIMTECDYSNDMFVFMWEQMTLNYYGNFDSNMKQVSIIELDCPKCFVTLNVYEIQNKICT